MLSAPWSGWTMMVLLICAVLSEWFQPGVIVQSPASLFARTDRTYKESPTNFMGQLLITVFRIGTIAMALSLCFCPNGHAPFAAFWVSCGWIVAALCIKLLCAVLIDYTFALNRRFGSVYEPYGDLITLGTIILYPIVLIMLHYGTPFIAQWVVGVWTIVLLVVWGVRCARIYLVSPLAMFYIIVYVATLEILPIAGLTYLSAKTIILL